MDFLVRIDATSCDESNGAGRLTLSGDLSIRNAQSIYQQILDAKEKCSTLHIVLEQVTSIDLALLQILFALKRDLNNGVQLTIVDQDSATTNWFAMSGLTSLIQSA